MKRRANCVMDIYNIYGYQRTFKKDSRSVPRQNLHKIKSHRMENNIPTLYILQRDSYVVKNKNFLTISGRFVQKI